jgi:predicted permease
MSIERWLYIVRLRLRSLIHRERLDQELNDELEYHARTEGAAIASIEQLKEECRDMRRTQFFDQFLQDIRYAFRSLLKSPAFAIVTLLSLALGIGANTAIFSLLDKLMLESLPVERPRELVILNPDGMRSGWTDGDMTWSYPAYAGLRDHQQVFTGLVAERTDAVNLTIDGATQRATESVISGNYFEVLGVRALLGRTITPGDDRVRDGHPVAVVSHGFWVERLGARPEVVGQTIRLNNNPFTIVGVTEKGFDGLEVGGTIDVFVPVAMLHEVVTYGDAIDSRSSYIFQIYGRLKPGMSRENAAAQMQAAYHEQLEEDVAAMGARGPRDDRWKQGRLLLEDGHRGTSGLRKHLGTPLKALLAMTGVVLLIACANIAGLLMARAASRTREIAIRLAIGASRGRIVRQLLSESALLAVLGGLTGLLVAWLTISLLLAQMNENTFRLKLVTSFLDAKVLGYALLASLATGILFGLLSALHASRQALSSTLKIGASADRAGEARLRRSLVTLQVALGLVLITAAGLFLRTLSNLRNTETGFRTERLIQFYVNAGTAGYDRPRSEALFREVLNDLRGLPGVSGATLALSPVMANSRIGFSLDVEGYSHGENERSVSFANAVAPGYFKMLGTPLLRGRDFSEADGFKTQRVAIVNETFVRRYFPDRDPLGRHFKLSWGINTIYTYEIVGVSRDARLANLRDQPQQNFFMPYTQWDYLGQTFFYVRASGDTAGLGGPIREVMKRRDPNIPIVAYRTVDEQIDRLLRPERMVASLSLAFGLLATGLAAIGLYGVTAFSVARRTREIGIRMALGAARGDVLKMVLRDVALMALAGICVGIALSLGLARYIESQLYGIPARDLVTMATAAIALAVIALASGWLPARRASRVDPLVALRQD